MATINVILIETEFVQRQDDLFLQSNKDTAFPQANIDLLLDVPIVGRTQQAQVDTSSQKGVINLDMDLDDLIYEDLWCFLDGQQSVTNKDLGFITEQSQFDILFWNTHSTKDLTLQSVTENNFTGLVSSSVTTPYVLYNCAILEVTVTVLVIGPPFQDSSIDFQFDCGFMCTFTIEGRRIEAWRYNPNWKDGIRVKYEFKSVLIQSNRFVEQRRPIYEKIRVTQKCDFWFEGIDLQKFLFDLRKFFDSIIGTPLYSEPITPTGNLVGLSTINVEETLTDYFNLNNLTTFLLIKSTVDCELFEIKQISSFPSATQIQFVSPVNESFLDKETEAFPIFLATIKNIKPKIRTSNTLLASLEFNEFK